MDRPSSATHWAVPHKAIISPAQVFDHPVSTSSLTETIPRDYNSHSQSGPSTRTGSSGAISATSSHSTAATTATAATTNEELISLSNNRRLSRVSELLHNKMESPPHTPRALSNFTVAESPYSSTDSLASLVERQQNNKINNPCHESSLFCKAVGRRPSTASLLAVLQGQPHRKRFSDSIPTIRSPLKLSVDNGSEDLSSSSPSAVTATTSTSVESRKLHPHLNPHHVHSTPAVKESKTVSLGYDPVSRKKMLNSYEIIKEIGRGEHGKVKLARHLETEELVAIKIVDRKSPKKSFRLGSSSTSHEEKIRREIAIMKKINHPNVVQLKEVMDDVNSRKIYLVLEYLEKGEVKWQKAKDVPMMSLKESMMVFRDVVLGLEYLHYQGIVHRDIKPANLLIARDGSVKISDFGVSFASSLKSGEQDDYDLAKTAGTPAFLAPELCRPYDEDESTTQHPKITYKIDIWALGVTLYCFLFGKLPFWATNEFELFDVIYSKELSFPDEFTQDFSDEDKENALDLLNKILDKDPTRRLTIKEIKNHPLTLRDLSCEEAETYTQGQNSCECKIAVSKEEVQVAVTGLGSKLRKGLAKALKFAGFQTVEKAPHPATAPVSPTLTLEVDDDPLLCDANSCHRRVKSSDISKETHANVEGDLFLNNSSALNSLNTIFNDDKRRSSVSSNLSTATGNRSSTMASESMSNDSSLSRGTQLVSLPVNASFASLDSVYLDNFAPSYAYNSTIADARSRPSSTLSRRDESGDDVFSKMNGFEMNKRTRKKSDDVVAPNHVNPTFCLHGDDEEEDDHDGDNERDDEFEFEFGADGVSELSVPAYLVEDFDTASTATGAAAVNEKIPSAVSKPLPNRGDKPKYSFFETSDDDDDDGESYDGYDGAVRRFSGRKDYDDESLGPEVIFAESSDEESTTPVLLDSVVENVIPLRRHRTTDSPSYALPIHVEEYEHEHEHEHADSDDDSSDGELTLSFGGGNGGGAGNSFRARGLSLSGDVNFTKRPERVSSPLAHNAPRTPIASSNAHSHPHPLSHEEYTNHYHRVQPQVVYHNHHGAGGTVENRGRSNSITVGYLKSRSN